MLLLLLNGAELCCFFLKFNLWLSAEHPLMVFRVFVMGANIIPGFREYYEYMLATDEAAARGGRSPRACRLGCNAWLSIVTMCVEALVIFKFWVLDPEQYSAHAR